MQLPTAAFRRNVTALALAGFGLSAVRSAGAGEAPATRACAVLQDLAQSGTDWPRIHAAEALIALGEKASVEAQFHAAEPALARSPCRVGAWRVLACAAATPDDRRRWIAKIEAEFLDLGSSERTNALETLCKLGWRLDAREVAAARVLLEHSGPDDRNLLHWNLGLGGDPDALAALAAALASTDLELRGSAAYALRWLEPPDPATRRAVELAAGREPADTAAYPYIVSAALSLIPGSTHAAAWRRELERVIATGSAAARYEAAQALMLQYEAAHWPEALFVPLLDAPEADARIAGAWTILHVAGTRRSAQSRRDRRRKLS